MTMLIFERAALRKQILDTFDRLLQALQENHKDQVNIDRVYRTVRDISYMAKQDCLEYCINNTDWIPSLILILEKFYFIDVRAPRTEMVEYA